MAYVPHTDGDRREMLEALGLSSLEDLFRGIPESLRLRRPLAIPPMRTEAEILADASRMAQRNTRLDDRPSFLGAGVYRRFVPAAVDALSARGELNTAYTPYQAEVSQGTLQAVMEYQTMIAELTGMEIANASMYDPATALAEAVLMAHAVRSRGQTVVVSEGVHPEYRRVLETYLRHHPVRVMTLPLSDGVVEIGELADVLDRARDEVLAVVVQNPNFLGSIEDTAGVERVIAATRKAPGDRPFLIAVVDPISLGLLAPPGSYGADVAIGDGQQLGNPPVLGGPTFGFFATRLEHVRKVPGRIVGETRDAEGRRGYVLTFQTREQHIRRERATSNICTNQGLCSLRGAMYLALLGHAGVREVAETTARKARFAFDLLTKVPGVEPVHHTPFFQEFPLRLPVPAHRAYDILAAHGIGGGLPLDRYFPRRSHEMLFAFTEMTSVDDIRRLAASLQALSRDATAVEHTTSRSTAR